MSNSTVAINQPLIIRPIEASDNPAIKQFMEASPDGGMVSIQTLVKVQDVQRAHEILVPGNYGLAAYLPGVDFPVGMVYGRPHKIQYGSDNSLCQAVLVNNLAVHSQYRRQGIATALVKEIVKWAEASYDPAKLLIYAHIQKGNAGSQATFARLDSTFTGQYITGSAASTLPLDKAAATTNNYLIREVAEAELAVVAAGLNQFYQGYDFYQPQTAETLKEWLAPKEIDGTNHKLARYFIATDKAENGGKVQAGMGVFNASELFEGQVLKVPFVFKALNKFLKLIPADGRMRSHAIRYVWYNPGQLEAAQELWQAIRKQESSSVSLLTYGFNSAGPLKALFNPAFFRPSIKNQVVLLKVPPGVTTHQRLVAVT